MMKNMKKIFALFVLLFLIACGGEVPPQPVMQSGPVQLEIVIPETESDPPVQTESDPSTVNVAIKDFSFQPATVNVNVGDTVVWTQMDGARHTVTIISGPETFDSGPLASGDTFSHTFTKPGAYNYKCSPHPNMRGTVVVR